MKEKNTASVLYIALFFLMIALPLAGMGFYRNRSAAEKRILANFPELQEEGDWNWEYLSQLGDWFTDHFAFRTELAQAHSTTQKVLFGMSGEDSVICGRDGYLFYKDSLDDYLGRDTMDERERYAALRYLELIQEYAASQGADFVFTIAPNKNTLYPEYMPYYYRKIEESGEMEWLETALKESSVLYADLRKVFEGQSKVMYHKLDSHWNNEGAALAMEAILDAIGREHTSYDQVPYESRKDFEGDLYGMLYPLGTQKDQNIYYQKEFGFSYGEGFRSTEDMRVRTENPAKHGKAVVFRDSFGNSLLPFLAEEFESALFCRDTPYPVEEVEKEGADVLIFELVERHLNLLAKEAPVMAAPVRDFQEWGQEEVRSGQTMEAVREGGYLKITGELSESCLDIDSPIYVRCISQQDTKVFEAFPLSKTEQEDAYGFGLSIRDGELEEGTYIMEVLTKRDGVWITSGYINTYTFSE